MHVGYFIDGYYPVIDGVIKVVDAYATRLVKKCDVTIFTPRTAATEPGFDDRFPYKVVRCKSIMREGDDYPQGFPIVDPKFHAQIKDAKLDLIHVHSAFPVGLCAKTSAKRLGIPLVGTIHSDFRPDVIRYLGKGFGEQVIKLMMTVYNSCVECWTVNDVVGKMFCRDYGLKRPYRVMPYSTDHYLIEDVAAARNEVNEALDAFLDLSLQYEQENIPSLQGFLAWLSHQDIVIKRDMDQSNLNAVRIMTVHGSKGLQGNIVFLPDTRTCVSNNKIKDLIWINGLPFWITSKKEAPDTFKTYFDKQEELAIEERHRLLYVALTRASDRLYICGYNRSLQIYIQ